MLTYNGVTMDLMSINEMGRDAVMSPDGTDYLYTHFTIDVTCFLHYSYLLSAVVPGALNPGYSNFVSTDRQVRARLLVPRRQLVWDFETGGAELAGEIPLVGEPSFSPPGGGLELPDANPFIFRGPLPPEVGNFLFTPGSFANAPEFGGRLDGSGVDAAPGVGVPPLGQPNAGGEPAPGQINNPGESVEYLKSPMTGYDVDAKNGPVPLECSVQKVVGVNGFLINWRCETWINECKALSLSNASALLSNRWSMVYDVDNDYNTVRRVEGLAIFRTDALRFQRINPDDLRKQFFLPIPKAFKRANINVQGSTDGTAVQYSYTDVQTPVVFIAPPGNPQGANQFEQEPSFATRIEVRFQQIKALKDDWVGSMIKSLSSYYQFKINRDWSQQLQQDLKDRDAGGGTGGGGGGGSGPHSPSSPRPRQIPQPALSRTYTPPGLNPGQRLRLPDDAFNPAQKARR